ncbi:MAG: N-6 DNA methylase [Microthrixaceae bacterium]
MTDRRAAAVAVRAAEIARAAGVTLSEDLALWRLAGGRPDAEAVAGEPDELGRLLETSHSARERQTRGAHYTSAGLADAIAQRALAGHIEPTVCDPACGGGALLLAAGRVLAHRGEDPLDVLRRLRGIDIDPLAVATTEVALTLWAGAPPPRGHLVVADALTDPPDWSPVDVVLGNPPFLGQLARRTTRTEEYTARLRARFGDAVRAYTDTAGVFLLAGCALVRAGGTVSMVQPQSIAAARDAAGVRAAVATSARLREVWVPEGRPFRAAVQVCIVTLDVGEAPSLASAWGAHLAHAMGAPTVDLAAGPTVLDEGSVGAAFRAEYYGTVPHVHEQEDLPGGRPLLTSGLVDLGRSAWGERPARVGGARWARPVVDEAALEGRAADWARRTSGPKLVMATQSRVVEAVPDIDGRLLPSVPLVVAWPAPERLWAVAAALCSPPVAAWIAARSAGTGLSAHALRLTAGLVRQVPLPPDADAWRAGAAAFEAGDLDRFAAAMTAAYGCDESVSAWWRDRCGSAWSPCGPAG